MTSDIFNKLDSFLAQNDWESMSWCNGMEDRIAENYLSEFKEKESKPIIFSIHSNNR